MADERDDSDAIEERIPGERDEQTAMPSERGIIAGTGYGENVPPDQPDTMTERTRLEREREGGGAPDQRPKPRAESDRPGSATGSIGGGGPDAHNPSPVRATGVDDPSVSGDRGSE